jgi:hypothetical protein
MANSSDASRPPRRERPTGGPPRPTPSQSAQRARAAAPEAGLESPDQSSPALPSSLGLDQRPSAARSGRAELEHLQRLHKETSPDMTAGDVDADWVAAYSVGDEAPGGDNPTPDQVVVEEVGKALGVEYADGEELAADGKIADRDRHRWELDPASSEDYAERSHGSRIKKRPASS